MPCLSRQQLKTKWEHYAPGYPPRIQSKYMKESSSGTVLGLSWSTWGTRDHQRVTAQDPQQGASYLNPLSSQAGTYTRAKVPCSSHGLPHPTLGTDWLGASATWLSGNSWPQLPAGIKGFRPPCSSPHSCPWLRTHQPVGRRKDPGDTERGEVPAPLSSVQWTLYQRQERDNAVLNTGLYWW